MTKTNKKLVLGRGLDSLIDTEPVGSSSISEVDIRLIKPNPDQPRQTFDEESLAELAASIKHIGLVQPITLRRSGDEYLIISGERRWRASQIANLTSIPAYIRTADDDDVMEMALVENIQREDLNAIEIALAYQKLLQVSQMTQEELGVRVGKKRTTISNYLRLLRLPAEVQLGLTQRKVDMGHARALLRIEDPEVQLALYQQIVAERLSVREVEDLASQYAEETTETLSAKRSSPQPAKNIASADAYKALSNQLAAVFGKKVKLSCNDKGRGKLSIAFDNEEELEQIMILLEKLQHD